MFLAPQSLPEVLVVLLHGYGSCGEGMHFLAQSLESEKVCFWMPDGFEDFEGGVSERFQWFSLKNVQLSDPITFQERMDKVARLLSQQIVQQLEKLETYCQKQFHTSFSGKVILSGFSQGAAMAMHTGLHFFRSQSILAFSGFYPCIHTPLYPQEIFWFHGLKDDVVPIELMDTSVDLLRHHGLKVQTSVCPQANHYVSALGLKEAKIFLEKQIVSML
jgi:phospholipase/carboxylesterase